MRFLNEIIMKSGSMIGSILSFKGCTVFIHIHTYIYIYLSIYPFISLVFLIPSILEMGPGHSRGVACAGHLEPFRGIRHFR